MVTGVDSGAEATRQVSRVNNADGPVVLFDGWCPLCVGTIQFLLRRDREARIRFAPLDSSIAKELLRKCEAADDDRRLAESGSTVTLIRRGRLHTRSDAAIRIAAELPLPWRALALLRVVPRTLRDRVYALVAERRHEVWGRFDACHMPDPADQDRFL
jgi:predicted DCC family thiol-disulfide oxidoreductase YuxK